jgi:hypothetical protein
MTCAVIGDSIAEAQFTYFPACIHDAKIGIPSAAVIGRVHAVDTLIVSAGSNDPDNPKLLQNLQAIRAKATGKVIWIVPLNPKAARAVLTVARDHNDKVVTFTQSNDHVHPKYNGQVAKAIREAM